VCICGSIPVFGSKIPVAWEALPEALLKMSEPPILRPESSTLIRAYPRFLGLVRFATEL
jgi:hypothetical protein